VLSALTVLSYQENLAVFGLALIHLAPALVVALTNFWCRLADRPADWPPWLLITGLLNAVIAFIVLVFDVDPGDKILTVTLLLAILVLIGTILTEFFSAIEYGLGRIPWLGAKLTKWFPAPTLYAWSLISLSFLPFSLKEGFRKNLLAGDSEAIVLAAVFGIACVLAVLARRTLWDSAPLLIRWLPHIPAWITLTLLLTVLIGPGKGVDSDFVLIVIVLTTPVAVLYWGLLRLRCPLVDPLPEGQSERAESIQSRAEHYIDKPAYHSNRLQASVRRSDGGVFGVTGVRGAGKSALTRHLLAQFKPDHFTLEITAPVRHDPDLGFFISVCRAVCRKTLDDLEPILQGTRAGAGGKLWQQIRNPLLILFALVAVFSLLSVWMGGPSTGARPVEITRGEKAWDDPVQDPLLGWVDWYETLPIEAERKAVDDLLTQIDQALGKEADQASQDVGYLLVPASDPGRFSLLWYGLKKDEEKDADARKALSSYKTKLGPAHSPLQSPFSFSSLPERQQKEWLESIEGMRKNRSDVTESDLTHWAALISEAKDKRAAPFAHLSRELGLQLRSPAGSEQEVQTKLVSELVLAAFADADPRLAFKVPRLREFREVLRVYRHLLDGDVIPRVRPIRIRHHRVSSRTCQPSSGLPLWVFCS